MTLFIEHVWGKAPKMTPNWKQRRTDYLILKWWDERFDTWLIARQLKIPEHEVYNRLPHIRGIK